MCAARHAGHQQPTVSAVAALSGTGTGTDSGRYVHQHGGAGMAVAGPVSAIAQEKVAPQRAQVLIGRS